MWQVSDNIIKDNWLFDFLPKSPNIFSLSLSLRCFVRFFFVAAPALVKFQISFSSLQQGKLSLSLDIYLLLLLHLFSFPVSVIAVTLGAKPWRNRQWRHRSYLSRFPPKRVGFSASNPTPYRYFSDISMLQDHQILSYFTIIYIFLNKSHLIRGFCMFYSISLSIDIGVWMLKYHYMIEEFL